MRASLAISVFIFFGTADVGYVNGGHLRQFAGPGESRKNYQSDIEITSSIHNMKSQNYNTDDTLQGPPDSPKESHAGETVLASLNVEVSFHCIEGV